MALTSLFAANMAKMIGQKLLEDYLKRHDSGDSDIDLDLLPTDGNAFKIVDGVQELINGNFLSEDDLRKILDQIVDDKDISKGKVATAVKALQRTLTKVNGNGVSVGAPGIFDLSILKSLFGSPRCKGSAQYETKFDLTKSTSIKNAFNKKERRIRFFLQGSLPQIKDGGNARDLFIEAWHAWLHIADIDVLAALSPNTANLIVTQANIDARPGGILADANLGPIGEEVFSLRFDSGESPWESTKFKLTAMHEIGHLLGLRHATSAGHLMSAFHDPTILKPTAKDKEALLSLPRRPWKPATPQKTAKLIKRFEKSARSAIP